jgi:hypothetical protein
MFIGTLPALRWLIDGMTRVAYALPGWRLFSQAPTALIERFGQPDPNAAYELQSIVYEGVPIEPLLIMLGLTAVLLAIAGRIWQEVEG